MLKVSSSASASWLLRMSTGTLWIRESIFAAAFLLASFFDVPLPVKVNIMIRPAEHIKIFSNICRKFHFQKNLSAYSPISTNFSTLHVMVNSLRCAGPDSCVTVYSGNRHPFCTTNSYENVSNLFKYSVVCKMIS